MRAVIATLVLASALVPSLGQPLVAGDIDNTLPGYNPYFGAMIGSDGVGDQFSEAAKFTIASGSYKLTSIRLALGDDKPTSKATEPASTATVQLFADNGHGKPSGTALETLMTSVSATLPVTSTTFFSSVLHPTLTSGSYWLVVSTGPSSTISWQSSSRAGPSLYSANNGAAWNSDTFNAAYEIQGTPNGIVPEPSAGMLVVTGLVAFAGFRRKAKQAQR